MTDTSILRGVATISFWAAEAEMEAAKRWYTELLGLDPYFERSGPDGRLAGLYGVPPGRLPARVRPYQP
jgi:hypothetical protein